MLKAPTPSSWSCSPSRTRTTEITTAAVAMSGADRARIISSSASVNRATTKTVTSARTAPSARAQTRTADRTWTLKLATMH